MATFDCFLVYLTLHLICIRHVASNGSPGSSVSIVTMLPVGRPGFDSWEGRDFFFFFSLPCADLSKGYRGAFSGGEAALA